MWESEKSKKTKTAAMTARGEKTAPVKIKRPFKNTGAREMLGAKTFSK
ncbi:MAG: hypothetical protein ACTTJV_05885 [Ottowia sp.]